MYKEAGFTSFDVVAKLRKITHQKKIGHTGTLDPDAVGVLPVCFGNATKVCALLTDWDKTYETVLHLGLVTDTQDISGQVKARSEVASDSEDVRRAVMSFLGDYDQLPPMYSAKKINGKRLYDLARQGIEVERKTCRVHINEIDILKMWWEGEDRPSASAVNRVRMSVNCSKGTYIRTLCSDIGDKLGCGGCMEYLKRTSVGPFVIDNALRLCDIEKICEEEGSAESAADPVDSVFMDYPAVFADSESERFLFNGNELTADEVSSDDEACDSFREGSYRVYDHSGRFTALYAYEADRRIFKPVKMFLPVQ